MSRIGSKLIEIPKNVKVQVNGDHVNVEGPKGKLEYVLPRQISVLIEGTTVSLKRQVETRVVKALHGLSRSLINNMIEGVNTGFKKDLEINGVGFKAVVKGNNLDLNVGFSHPVLLPIPEGIKVQVNENTQIAIEGYDKQVVGQFAAEIRSIYPPEPYKGKGIKYKGEIIRRKAGKTVQ
ncbi:MAG: 50S ribosomal protein L6 [Verrucomicrobiota bacterium]|nr:50S ribosomal protein L6 [Verrucomicrobiota bacterium]